MTADTTMIRMVAQHVGMGVARRAAEHELRGAARDLRVGHAASADDAVVEAGLGLGR